MNKMSERKLPFMKKFLFGISAIPDQMTYQAFTLYVFTFYFAVVGLSLTQVWIGFIIWAVWNMLNDPILGALSDRTKHKGKLGKRRYYMVIAVVPLSLTMIFLFTVPMITDPDWIQFAYFLFIIMLFEFFYTMFDVNVNALFPEMFPTEDQRAQTNIHVKAFTVVGVILASLPTLILSPMAPTIDPIIDPIGAAEQLALIRTNYLIAGIILGVITVATALPFLIKGIKEREETTELFENRPTFFQSLKHTFKNKTFLKFVVANTMVWYVFNTLMTIFPLYFVHVIGVDEEAFIITLSLVFALLVAAFVLPFHRFLGKKLGMRNAFMITLGLWIVLLFPFLLLNPGDLVLGVIITAIQGFALSGALFYVDILIGDVIDEDSLKFGVKRSASYYGINALIHRFSTILSITTIALVFSGTGWSGGYEPNPGIDVIIGLKLIVMLFPAIGCAIAIIFLKWFDLHGEKLKIVRAKLAEKEN